jgi:hypothetical protein
VTEAFMDLGLLMSNPPSASARSTMEEAVLHRIGDSLRLWCKHPLREGRATTGRDMAIRHQYPAFAADNLILLIATPRPLGGEVCLYGTSVS